MKRSAIVLMAAAMAGCVTTGRFKAQQDEAYSQKKRAEAAESHLADAQKAGQDLQAQLKAKADELASAQTALKAKADELASLQTALKSKTDEAASLQTSNKDLQQSLEAKKGELSKKVAELIKERDELTAKVSARDSALAADAAAKKEGDAEVASLKSQLAEAEAARKSIETQKAEELEKVKKSYEDLTAGLKSEIAAGSIQITQLKGKLTVNMVDRILFDSGEASVKRDGKKILEKVGGILNGVKDKDIRIEGHTDDKPITGDLRSKYPTNWELSTARATAVARYLEDEAKVDPKRLVATGYGEYRPVADNATAEGRALNRRIEIVLVPRD